ALALRVRAGRVGRAHEALESDPRPLPERVARAEVLYRRVVRANRGSQALTVMAVVATGVSVGLSLRARRLRRARLRLEVGTDLAGLSLGLSGVLP
ncbi:MAG: hypothetical protein KC593_01575, partial [Myxococcales bacterium]|nr:hypothetical protein [Myxococcales bacterium]